MKLSTRFLQIRATWPSWVTSMCDALQSFEYWSFPPRFLCGVFWFGAGRFSRAVTVGFSIEGPLSSPSGGQFTFALGSFCLSLTPKIFLGGRRGPLTRDIPRRSFLGPSEQGHTLTSIARSCTESHEKVTLGIFPGTMR